MVLFLLYLDHFIQLVPFAHRAAFSSNIHTCEHIRRHLGLSVSPMKQTGIETPTHQWMHEPPHCVIMALQSNSVVLCYSQYSHQSELKA